MKSPERVINLDPLIRDELRSRVNSGQYVFPIQATYGMRMMTPAPTSGPADRASLVFTTQVRLPDWEFIATTSPS